MNNLVPFVIERSGQGERSCDIYSRLLRERIIFLVGPIDDNLSSLICAQMLFLESEDSSKDIYMYINSPGGSVTAGLAIYDTMQYVGCDVATFCFGQAYSAGSLLLVGGASGKRSALPNSRIMIHQPSGGMRGQVTDCEIQLAEMVVLKKIISKIYCDHTGKSDEDVHKALERDKFLSSEESKEFGIVDMVVKSYRDFT